MNRVARSTTIYLISNILNAGIPFLLLPLLTRVLSEAEYGQLAMFQTLILGFSAVVGLSVHGAANRKFFDKGVTEQQISSFNNVCLIILIISSFFVFLFVYIFNDRLESLLLIPSYYIYSALFISTAMFVIQLRLGQWQIRSETSKYASFQILQSIVNITLSLFLVLSIYNNSLGRVNAQVITAIIFIFVSVFSLKKRNLISFNFKLEKNEVKEALSFGVPLIPHTIGVFCISSLDKLVITNELGLDATAIYMVALQLSLAMSILFDALNKAYVPWLFGKLKLDNFEENKKIVKLTYIYFFMILMLSVLAFILGPLIMDFIAGDKYKSANEIIGVLCLGQGFGGMYLMVTNYTFYAKKTGYLSMVTIFCGSLNLFLLTYFIPRYGIEGAAYSFAFIKFLQFIITWVVAAKIYKMPWGLK